MPTTWLMPHAARERLTLLPLAGRGLLEAITEAGDRLITLDWDKNAPSLAQVPLTLPGPVAVYGGHRFLDHLWHARPDLHRAIWWSPQAHSHQAVAARLGTHLLNAAAQPATRADVRAAVASGPIFVRPDAGNKACNGGVISTPEAADALPDIPLIMGAVFPITAEYRFIIAQGRVVTGSQYRRDGRIDIRIDTEPDCAALAALAADLYSPLPLFTCDVAQTPHGPRVVEYNSFSASGFYACDGHAIVAAVHALSSPP